MEALFKAWNLYLNKLILWFWCLPEFEEYCRVEVFSPVIPQIEHSVWKPGLRQDRTGGMPLQKSPLICGFTFHNFTSTQF